MKPITADTHPSVSNGTPNRHAPGSSEFVDPQLERARFRSSQPLFSEESSATEYTSDGDAPDDGNCVESRPNDTPRSQDQAPSSVASPSLTNIKSERLATSQQAVPSRNGLSSIEITPGCTSISIPRTGSKTTPVTERHEIKDGKEIVVLDLGDSDEEAEDSRTKRLPLCSGCKHKVLNDPSLYQALLQKSQAGSREVPSQVSSQVAPSHARKAETLASQKLMQAVDTEEVHTPKVRLVVDLSGNASQLKHAEISEVQKGRSPLVTPVSAKAETSKNSSKEQMKPVSFTSRKQVEQVGRDNYRSVSTKGNGKLAETSTTCSGEQFKTAAVYSNGVQAVMDFSKEQMKASAITLSGIQVDTQVDVSRNHMKKGKDLSSTQHVESGLQALRSAHEKVRETSAPEAEESEDEASTLSEDYMRGVNDGQREKEKAKPDWSADVLCDLCERGPALSLGAWYSWCCGNPSNICVCPYDEQQRKKRALKCKGGKSWKTTDPPYPWSGKVHKLCALWSAEVFEDSNQPLRIMKLWAAVQRSRKSKCSDPDCGLFGATLGCRVASCKKNFHYPCADKLSVSVKVRMWDGLMKPIACKDHRHVDDVLDDVKLQKEKSLMPKKRKRGSRKSLPPSFAPDPPPAADPPKLEERISGGLDVINLDSSGEEDSPRRPPSQDVTPPFNPLSNSNAGPSIARRAPTPDNWPTAQDQSAGPKPYGKKLLCPDFSGGLEPIEVPCTNDVDDEPPPYLEYITKSRYAGEPLGSKEHCHPLFQRPAKACDGCTLRDPDDPLAPISVHIPFTKREDDFREDWLRERMYGRLPYDKYARLVIGTDYNELVECNDRCKCGDACINREMQKGLRTPIELYKTTNKGWAVRALVPIPRGQFVIEYVGEMLTQDQAQRYGQIYDEIKRSYLYDLDYPESRRTPDFTLDGFHASNVARFINHSCDANLKIYRVYVETTYKWLSHIGMFAMRDIEPGEELSYDYNYGRHDLQVHDGGHSKSLGEQKMEPGHEPGHDSRHIKCHCGAKNCREWLWRPMHTGDDSDEDRDEN